MADRQLHSQHALCRAERVVIELEPRLKPSRTCDGIEEVWLNRDGGATKWRRQRFGASRLKSGQNWVMQGELWRWPPPAERGERGETCADGIAGGQVVYK